MSLPFVENVLGDAFYQRFLVTWDGAMGLLHKDIHKVDEGQVSRIMEVSQNNWEACSVKENIQKRDMILHELQRASSTLCKDLRSEVNAGDFNVRSNTVSVVYTFGSCMDTQDVAQDHLMTSILVPCLLVGSFCTVEVALENMFHILFLLNPTAKSEKEFLTSLLQLHKGMLLLLKQVETSIVSYLGLQETFRTRKLKTWVKQAINEALEDMEKDELVIELPPQCGFNASLTLAL